MGKIEKIQPSGIFTNYIFKSIPLAFDESLSYYEVLCGVLDKLKTQEEVINNNADLLAELEQYVIHYFDNLDVQEEINNKLDEMAENGELTDIIAQYLELAGVLAYNTLNELIGAENVANGSICYIIGKITYNDGLGAYYKIRNIINTDVIDGDNIIAITNNPNLVGEKLPNAYISDLLNKIGNLSNLNTTNKSNVVNAINEVNNNVSSLETDIVPFYCILRANASGWGLLNDSDHSPLNVQSVEIDPNNSAQLKLNHAITGVDKIYSFSIVPDETFSKYGIRAGASVGINTSYIQIYQTISANAYFRYQNGNFNLQSSYSNLVKSFSYDTTKHCLKVIFDDNLKCTTPEYWYADFNFATSTASSQLATKLKVLYTDLCEVEVYAYDSNDTLLTTPGSLDRVNVFYEINRRVNPSDLVTHAITGSNFWICGYMKKSST